MVGAAFGGPQGGPERAGNANEPERAEDAKEPEGLEEPEAEGP